MSSIVMSSILCHIINVHMSLSLISVILSSISLSTFFTKKRLSRSLRSGLSKYLKKIMSSLQEVKHCQNRTVLGVKIKAVLSPNLGIGHTTFVGSSEVHTTSVTEFICCLSPLLLVTPNSFFTTVGHCCYV